METDFSRFVNFGSVANKDKRAELASSIYEQLQKKQNAKTLSNGDTDNFAAAIEKILSNEAMQELCAKDPSLAKQVTQDILDFVNKTKRHILKTGNPFEKERQLLEEFKTTQAQTFEKSWENIASFIAETYSGQIIDTEFYHNEFQKSLDAQENNSKKISFQSVKEHFTDKWDALLFQKELQRELEIIEEQRKKFCEELYRQIEQLKKLQELLAPFTNELGRLWDMSRGRWQKVNFDVLKKYADLLERDKSLQELAEMLGRMRQAEREYEEEIFASTIFKPAWKAEHAAKEELVGIRESDDISSMLPAEAALLADEDTELLFYKKFVEKKLQTFDYQAKILSWEEEQVKDKRQKEKEGKKGPFIVCVDTSGSMHGTPETVAKTLCFALLKTAVRENRKCYLISFSTQIETLELTDMKNNLEKLVEFLSMSFNGGTDAGPAMREALKMLQREDYQKADCLMISDFVMGAFDEQTKNQIAAAKENKTKFHSLVIGGSGNQKTITEFDSNWLYNPNDKNCLLQFVKDFNNRQGPLQNTAP
ncbi:MAG: VWA domain-containing protein [Spirochaetes bacterium]|nr:VWA domain-containing protein [Spirochaetota bacterium]